MAELVPETREVLRFRARGGRTWVRFDAAATDAVVIVNGVEAGRHLGAWTPYEVEVTGLLRGGEEVVEVVARDAEHATNGFLPRTGMRWTGVRGLRVQGAPTPPRPPAVQRSRVDGTRFLVDGRPRRVRGILHWGSYPELGRPWPDEDAIRREVRAIRDYGFDLVKLCLWVPPESYYAICDEEGMLVWQEYPVWDAPLDDPAVACEIEEMMRLDAPYPCVVLRTLTCENDRVDRELGRRLVERCREIVPGAVVLENSSWLCRNGAGDFHDEHVYLHGAQWRYLGRRLRPRLSKPLLLGEAMAFDTAPDGSEAENALAVRKWQVQVLARDLPDAGYVVTGLRDVEGAPVGLFTRDGRPKWTPEEWAWHRDDPGPPREVPELDPEGPRPIGPRKGEWKHREHAFWSPVVRVHPSLGRRERELVARESMFELLAGRVLERCEGTRVLVELVDFHDRKEGPARFPLAVECASEGRRLVVTAFRRDTPVGRELHALLETRDGEVPEIGPLSGTAVVLERGEMSPDRERWEPVLFDTPLANGGRNVFEGQAWFRARFEHPGGACALHALAVGDSYELWLDGRRIAEAGPRDGTWDGVRDVPLRFPLELAPGEHELLFRVRDWRGGGGMVGPLYLATDDRERVL